MNYQELLETGQPVVRKVWVNENSTKDQVSVQFIQQIKRDTTGTPNKLIALAQGIDGIGQNLVTSIFSFAAVQAKAFGLVPGEYHEGESKTAKDVFGLDVNIQVVENTTPNGYSKVAQQPKLNPKTNEVLLLDGKPIYRHTELVEGAPVNSFLQHNSTIPLAELKEHLVAQSVAANQPD